MATIIMEPSEYFDAIFAFNINTLFHAAKLLTNFNTFQSNQIAKQCVHAIRENTLARKLMRDYLLTLAKIETSVELTGEKTQLTEETIKEINFLERLYNFNGDTNIEGKQSNNPNQGELFGDGNDETDPNSPKT